MRIPSLFYKTPKLPICSKSLSWQLQSQTMKAVAARVVRYRGTNHSGAV
jgi:hypothetical protein